MDLMHRNKTLKYGILGIVVAIALVFDLYILMARLDLFGTSQPPAPVANVSPRSGPIILTSAERTVANTISTRLSAQKPQPLSKSQLSIAQQIITRMQNQHNK